MNGDTKRRRWILAALVAGVVSVLLIYHLAPQGKFLSPRWPWVSLLAGSLALGELVWRRRRARGELERVAPHLYPGLVLVGMMVVFLLSRATFSPVFYFLRWNGIAGGSSYKAWLVRVFFYSLLLTPFFLWRGMRKWGWLVFLGAMFYVQWDCIKQFLETTGGLPLYRDDHPAFMYRLMAFGRLFPRLVYYDPFWNGGVVATYLISSGISAIGLLFWPIWRCLPIEVTYTPVLALIFMLLVPFMMVAAVRSVRGSWSAAFAAGVMAVLVNRLYLMWLLHFGTLGCCFSLAFSGLLAALLYRILVLGDTRWRTILALAVAGYCYLAWPPAGPFAIGLLPAFLVTARQWRWRTWRALIVAGVLVLLFLLPNILGILRHVHYQHYVATGHRHIEWAEQFHKGWKRLLEYCLRGHPQLVFLGVLGAFFLGKRQERWYWGLAILGMALVTGWGEMVRPHLEFPRAGIVLFFTACVPAGLWVGRLLEEESPRLAGVKAFLFALLVAGGLNAADLYENRGIERYCVMSDEVRNFAAWIRGNVPEGSRLLFAGPTVHGYGGGHVAYLPVMAGREMMACDFYHFSPKRVEYEYPPRGYRSYDQMRKFLELYNVSHISSFHGYWQRRLEDHPETFMLVHQFGRQARPKKVYRVSQPLSQCLLGAARVVPDLNRLTVYPEDPNAELVIKYNWADGLRCAAPAEIQPFPVDDNITLIRIWPNGARRVEIWFTG